MTQNTKRHLRNWQVPFLYNSIQRKDKAFRSAKAASLLEGGGIAKQ